MDVYTRFDLPPPPPPTIFSRDSSPGRARLPNFTDVDEVSDFIANAILWRHSQAVDHFLLFCTTYVALLEVVLSVFILHLIYQKRWWLFRLVNRDHGSWLVPNAHSWWALWAGLFGLLIFGACLSQHQTRVTSEPAPNVALLITLIWTPAVFAVWFQAWAILATEGGGNNTRTRSRFRLPPLLVGFCYLCLPMLPAVAAIVPGSVANGYYEEARHAWIAWHARYNQQVDLSRDMVLDAQSIFTLSLRGSYYLTTAMVTWLISCNIFGGLYAYASLGLFLDLRRLVSNDIPVPLIGQERRWPELHRIPDRVDTVDEFPAPDAPERAVLGSCRTQIASPFSTTDSINARLFSAVERQEDRAASFFPRVAPSSTVQRLKVSQARKVLFWFALQSISVVLMGLCLCATLIYFVVDFYPRAERNQAEHVLVRGFLTACAVSLIFGITTSASVTHSTFEASFAALMSAQRGKRCNLSP